ncbi:Chorismate mutase [Vigna angularis]|uniref:chorismate mutase n=1 Tax=Phaseolus angularis TaxID=3914 RepID=A0A8T0JM32_PHAAN|nr:Chorismate mutase [Vigna angularis]
MHIIDQLVYRNSLIQQEDTIIFSLLERSQYSHDSVAYDKDVIFLDDSKGSLVDYMLFQHEKLHAQVGRYKSEEENTFFPQFFPNPRLPHVQYPQVLHHCADSININHKIRSDYFEKIVPEIAKAKNNDEGGSIAVCDILCLQDRKLLLELLTDKTVEAIVKKRVELKAKAFGQVVQIDEAYNVANPTYKINPSFIANLFEEWVMPLTKEVQVEYLLRILD